MARKKRLGSVASEVFAYGDIDTMASGDFQQQMLAAHEAMEKHAVREASERFVGRLRLLRAGLGEQLADRAAHRVAAADAAADRIEVVERWRDLGIRERMTLRSISRGSKWALWLLIASLDFYIFAQVMAYAENIADPGLGDATFWLGGAVGITVFIVGILLAQAIRRASYYQAQKKLLRELKAAEEDTTGLRLSNYSRWMTISFAVFYIALTAGAVILRYQGGGKAQPGLLMLQTMIPVIAIMLELLIDDPTEIRLPQRTIRDWWLSHRIRRLDAKIALRELITNEREAAVSDRYRFESAALATLHDSNGMEGRIPAALQVRPDPALQPDVQPMSDIQPLRRRESDLQPRSVLQPQPDLPPVPTGTATALGSTLDQSFESQFEPRLESRIPRLESRPEPLLESQFGDMG